MEIPFDNLGEQEAIALLQQMIESANPNGVEKSPGQPVPSNEELAAHRGNGWQPDLRYRSLVEKLPVVTFMASLDDRVQELYVSPQIEVLLGFTQDEWLENPILWFRQLHPDDRDRWVQEFARTCSTGANFRAEYRLLARDGHVVWVQGECQLVRDEDGRPLFLQGIAFDITHLKHAAQVEEEKLAAEAASRAKSEFLARMSHEIRTPLNGVVGMIDLLSNTTLTEIQHRYAQLAREAAEALMLVINDVLDFSKIEAGKVEIEAIDFDLVKLIEDLTELLGPAAAKKKLILTSLVKPEIPRGVIGDPSRIRQILTNLISNALKFTPGGSVTVRASVDSRQGQHFIARIEVQDTGIGIPADRLDRLFKSFSQVDTSTTRKFGGTGLGLAISKRLVELMGGEIGITSVEGKGTTFWFTLKLEAQAQQVAPGETDVTEALREVRVLIAEADPAYRRILTEQLEGRLSAASQVVGTEDAIEIMRSAAANGTPFTVALIPYSSAEGSPLAAGIQADDTLRGASLIALMDIDDRSEDAAKNQAGIATRLHRPLTQSRLMDAIAAVTVRRVDRDALDATYAPAELNPLQGLHLLVAEDNEMNQFVTEETLRRKGCTCDIVADGALAVEAVTQRDYDVVLMDCQMPGMDGLEATRAIRAAEAIRPEAGRVPIIALTADAIQGDRERCLEAGMDGYVTKPINAEELFAAILLLKKTPVCPTASGDILASSTAPGATIAAPAAPDVAPALSAPQELPIDIESLVCRCMGDVDFAMRTLTKFNQRALEDVELLRNQLALGDAVSTNRLAHNLKAVAAHVAASPLRKIAFEMEKAAARDDLAFVEQQLSHLDAEVRRCASYMPEAIEQLARMPGAADVKATVQKA